MHFRSDASGLIAGSPQQIEQRNLATLVLSRQPFLNGLRPVRIDPQSGLQMGKACKHS